MSNKYQMPSIEELMDTVGQTISERKPGEVYFSTMDLTHASMQFFAGGRKINGHVSLSNGVLRPYNHASGISAREGYDPFGISAGACLY